MEALQDQVGELVEPRYYQLIRDPALVELARERNI